MRKNVKQSGMDMVGDVVEGGMTGVGVVAGAGVGASFGENFGESMGQAFNPAASYTGNVWQSGTNLGSKMVPTAIGSYGLDPVGGVVQDAVGTGTGRVPEQSVDAPERDATKSLEKSSGVVTGIIAAIKEKFGKKHAGTGAKVTRAIDRIFKRALTLGLDLVMALTLLPGVLYDVIKGIIQGVKDYKAAKKSETDEKNLSQGGW